MKILTKLNIEQVKKLLKDKKLTDVCIIPIKEELRLLLSKHLEDNTGLETKSVMGISRVFGEEGLDDCCDNISSLIGLKSKDFILEFTMPDDMVLTISYEDLIMLNNSCDLNSKKILSKVKIESHVSDYNEFAFLSLIDMKYCTGFKVITPEWSYKDLDIKKPEDLNNLSFFGGI